MSGFQFTPGGVVSLGETSNDADEAVIPANPDLFCAPEPRPPVSLVRKSEVVLAHKPLNIVKAAKARLRDVKREIKRLRKLEAERDELTRLLNAAEQKPCAVVHSIAAKRG